MKQTKKALVTMAACTLIGAMAIGGTFAYLTDEEQQVNTFTVGDVKIDLQEPGWDPDHPPVVPNEPVPKDPAVVNTGTNSAYAFVEVQIPKKNVTVVDSDGKTKNLGLQELFIWGTDTDAGVKWCESKTTEKVDGVHDDWTLIKVDDTQIDYNTYIFAYKKIIEPSTDKTNPTRITLFDKVKLVNIVEVDNIVATKVEMPIKAYAIQSNFVEIDSKLDGDAKLLAIYNVYVNQNENDSTVRDANEGNLTLGNEKDESTNNGNGDGDTQDTPPES